MTTTSNLFLIQPYIQYADTGKWMAIPYVYDALGVAQTSVFEAGYDKGDLTDYISIGSKSSGTYKVWIKYTKN